MTGGRHGVGLRQVRQALDEARFGSRRTLNLRDSLPRAAEAAGRTDAWLREQQVAAAGEVLVITGRGNHSDGGVSPVRESVLRLLHALRRRGVVAGHVEHTPGSFVVQLASMQALIDAPRRSREKIPAPRPPAPPSLDALSHETRTLLRNLTERVLESLGVQDKDPFMAGEMLRQFGVLSSSISRDVTAADREPALQRAIRRALDDYE